MFYVIQLYSCFILVFSARRPRSLGGEVLSEFGMIGRLDRHGRHVWRAISDFTSGALSPIVADIPFLFVAGIP